MMNEIIASVGKDSNEICLNNTIEFPMLNRLSLKRLPMMNSLWGFGVDQQQSRQARKVLFPSLEELKFKDMKINLEEVISLDRDSTSQLCVISVDGGSQAPQFIPPNWLLELRNLETLTLRNCRFHGRDLFSLLGNSLRINNPYNGTISFRNLEDVEVNSCGMSTIFTCSVAKTLQQLEMLKVTSCGSIEEIITDERRNDQLVVTDTNCEEILFPNLFLVELEDLPNLKSFCSSTNYSFKMPSLNGVQIKRCPQMLNFTLRQISTPAVRVFTCPSLDGEGHPAVEVTTDINNYLQQIMNTQEFVDKEEVKQNPVNKGKSIVVEFTDQKEEVKSNRGDLKKSIVIAGAEEVEGSYSKAKGKNVLKLEE